MNTLYPDNLTPSHNTLDIKEFWRTLVQQRYLIFLGIAIALAISIIMSLITKPVYRATTVIEIERQLASISGIGALNADDPRDNRDFYQTQYELIKSRSIAREVINRLNLADNMQSKGLKASIKGLLGIQSQPDLESIFIEGITVEPVNTSRLVRVSYDARSPEQAAKIVNTLTQVFIANNIKRTEQTAEAARNTLSQQLSRVKDDLQKAQQALAAFDREHTYINGKPQEVHKKEKLMEQLSDTMRKIQTLNSRLSYDPSVESDLEIAIIEEKDLRIEISALEEKINQSDNLEYDTLKESVQTSKAAYSNLQQKLKNINIASGFSANNFIVVDKAIPPNKKHKPKILVNLILGSLIGGLMGIALAFLRSHLDDSLQSVDDAENHTQLPVLAFTPDNTQEQAQIGLKPCTSPQNPLAEAYRTLKTSLKFIPEANDDNIIFITSSGCDEGKSTTAANLACLFAKSGHSVLLIDADLRNPCLHEFFNVERQNGLEELLSGSSTPGEELFKSTDIPNISIITAGKETDDPVNLIGNIRMEKMLELAISKYDHVIIDGAPVLGFADAQLLTNLATATLFVIKAGHTPKKAIKDSLQRLKQANGHLIGVLLTHVDMQKTQYQYGNYPSVKQKSRSMLPFKKK